MSGKDVWEVYVNGEYYATLHTGLCSNEHHAKERAVTMLPRIHDFRNVEYKKITSIIHENEW